MRGDLRARLELVGGRTVVTRQFAQYPLRLAVPEGPAGDPAALLYLGLVAGGLGEGDDLAVTLELGRGASAQVTTPSACKILTMRDGSASQRIGFELDEGSVLEYLPDEVIPFAGSNFTQEVTARLAPTATLVLTDLLTPGRTGRGEHFGFRSYRSRLRVFRDGQLVLHDRIDLKPAEMALSGVALLGEYSHYGTLVVVSTRAGAALAGEIADLLSGREGLSGSASTGPDFVVARLLGYSTSEVKRSLLAAWQLAHGHVIGRAATSIAGKLLC